LNWISGKLSLSVVEIDRRIRVASVYNRKRRKHAEIPGIAHAASQKAVKKRNTCCEFASPLRVRFYASATPSAYPRHNFEYPQLLIYDLTEH
jgi:hypothetical protein